jgi:hypothetical protein
MNVNDTLPHYTNSYPLQTEFLKAADGCSVHIFKQLKRQGDICLYSRTGLADGRPKGFEVFRLKLVKAGASLPGGAKVEADYEQYPGKSAFGKSAWSICGLTSEADAEAMFTKLTSNPEAVEVEVETDTDGVKVKAKRTPRDTNVVYVVPAGDFTQADFAKANGLPERGKVYGVLQAQVTNGLVKPIGLKKVGKGRPTAFFVKVS